METFATLVERYRRLVAALVARAGPRGETDDLVQEVFLDAYRKRDTLGDPGKFKGWIVQVALNRARMRGRRQRVEQAALPRLARPATAEDAPALEREEERRRTIDALGDLPDDMRAVVTLRYLEGRSAPEIAATLGITPEAVRMRLSRALAKLRERLS
jgi:RNA polymerase sigma-70 factor (ECF subfamily)